MDVGLGIAGLICVAMAFGHATVGLVWVLPRITAERLQGSPFGPPSMTLGMLRVTWHIVTVFALASGGLLMSLAWGHVDPETLLLRWFATMWVAAAAMAFSVGCSAARDLLRLPVPLLWVVLAVLCWTAST